MFSGRWDYWTRTVINGSPLEEPIPKIQFDNNPHEEVKKNLKDCIQYAWTQGHGSSGWMMLVDWILWGLNSNLIDKFPSKISEGLSWYWYKTFNMGLMLKYPADHMAWASCELASPKAWQGNGYFPTPMHICVMMAEMTYIGSSPEDLHRAKSKNFNDPCLGTGSMLLEASNFSLRLCGQDISLDMVKMATVNGYLFMPWLVAPNHEKIDWVTSRYNKVNIENALKILNSYKLDRERSQIKRLSYMPVTSEPVTKTGKLSDWF